MVSAGVLPAASDVMYAAMPADDTLSANQLGVPKTWKADVSVLPPPKVARMVAVEPAALAAPN